MSEEKRMKNIIIREGTKDHIPAAVDFYMRMHDPKLIDVLPVKQNHGEVDIERSRFIKMLFGRISPEEMMDEFYMYWFSTEDYRNIFEILFPKMQSHVVSLN